MNYEPLQGCALEVPHCHRQVTFAFGRLEKLPFLYKKILGSQSFMVTGTKMHLVISC